MNIPTVRRDYWPTQEWQTVESGSMGMYPDKLLELDMSLKFHYASINGIVIVRKGAFAASGHGGSHIFCVPENDLIVAIASKLSARPRDRWVLLNKYILPAIKE